MVAEGRFRETCGTASRYFPLSCRPCASGGKTLPGWPRISPSARLPASAGPGPAQSARLELLASYSWPGNVRELAAVIDRAAILGEGRTLEVAKALGWPRSSRYQPPIPKKRNPSPSRRPPASSRLMPPCDGTSNRPGALQRTRRRAPRAAVLLKINPHTAAGQDAQTGHRLETFSNTRN